VGFLTSFASPEPAAAAPAPAPVPAPAAAPAEKPSEHLDPRAWVTAELPPAYAEIAGRIEALREEARKYEEIAGVLWQVGRPLAVGVRDIFSALKFDATLIERESGYSVRVDLDAGRRLIVEVTGSPEAIDRKSPAITELLRLLQSDVSDQDRLVLAVNAWCDLPLDARKKDLVTADAVKLIQRVAANIVATSTLFGIWRYSLTNLDAARQSVMKLYSHDGGFFK
jgi:hypothetical protein